MQKLGVFWKIQDICYQMGTEILKIDEEMTAFGMSLSNEHSLRVLLHALLYVLWREYNFMVKNIYVDNSNVCHCSCICREDVKLKTVTVAVAQCSSRWTQMCEDKIYI